MIPRSESLREKDPSESTGIIPLVIPYHEFGRKVSHIVHKNAKILAKSRDIGCLFDKTERMRKFTTGVNTSCELSHSFCLLIYWCGKH